MANGKIKTIFTDKEKTDAIFPRTKVKAISTDDGIGLDAIISSTPHFSNSDNTSASIPLANAETLAGRPASEYATKDYVTNKTADFATESFVTNKIANAQLSGGGNDDIDLSGYVTKDEAYTTEGSLREAISAKASGRLVSNTVTLYTMEQLEAFIKQQMMITIPSDAASGGDGSYVSYFYIMAGEDGLEGPNSTSFQTGSLLTICRGPFNGHDTGMYSIIVTLEDGASGYRVRYHSRFNPGFPPEVIEEPMEWEWINPLMSPGYEYRTAERWQGKPVYTQLVNFGTLPDNTIRKVQVYYGADSANGLIRSVDIISITPHAYGDTNDKEWTSLPFIYGGNTIAGDVYYRDDSKEHGITVRTQRDLSKYRVMFTVKYTKEHA